MNQKLLRTHRESLIIFVQYHAGFELPVQNPGSAWLAVPPSLHSVANIHILLVLCLLRAHTTQLCDIPEVAHTFQKQSGCLAVR